MKNNITEFQQLTAAILPACTSRDMFDLAEQIARHVGQEAQLQHRTALIWQLAHLMRRSEQRELAAALLKHWSLIDCKTVAN